jgi:hypothetical protein
LGSGVAERLLLGLGKAIQDLLQVRLGKAGVISRTQLDTGAEAFLGHRHLDSFNASDQLSQLWLGLHQRPRGLDHAARFNRGSPVPAERTVWATPFIPWLGEMEDCGACPHR